MKVKLINSTDLSVCSTAIRECHGTKDKGDNGGAKDKALIHRIGNQYKHGSTLEHLTYTFEIEGVSRALLQELARHRIASMTVKSTRYTLGELANEEDVFYKTSCGGNQTDFDQRIVDKFLVMTPDEDVNMLNICTLSHVQELKKKGISNDILKYALPEAYKTSLTWTINARSLQNFIELRTGQSALWEIRNLANAIYEELPFEHKYLFIHFNKFEEEEMKE